MLRSSSAGTLAAMNRSLSLLLVGILGLAPACTLDLGGDDAAGDDTRPDPQPQPQPDPDPVANARLVIGTSPGVNAFHGDWATVWLNYPSVDCTRVERYGAELPVVADDAYAAFTAASGAVPGQGIVIGGWLSLRREGPDHLWHVAEWIPDGGIQPDCYRW